MSRLRKTYVSERQGQLVSFKHQGKKPCKKAQQAKEAKGKIRTLFQVGVKKVKALLLGTVSTSSDDSLGQARQAETERKGDGS